MLELWIPVMYTMGGGIGTRLIGNVAADRQMPIITVASFGGSSADLYEKLKYLYREKIGTCKGLEYLNSPWQAQSAEEIIGLTEAVYNAWSKYQPHLYFLSYSWDDSAIVVLNQVIRPFTAKWHRESLAGAFDDKEKCKLFRGELVLLQKDLRTYTKMLADMASVEDLTILETE